ncbi:putative ENTH domain-containing protein [Helianthus annuus]|nr:putative ENTH domain-containing protein [Helianthus annuus]
MVCGFRTARAAEPNKIAITTQEVLKVPSIEQKVLDATSNESWGPHGTHLADIAQASRNYHEYRIIMSVVWKRLSDTGKNWRHVQWRIQDFFPMGSLFSKAIFSQPKFRVFGSGYDNIPNADESFSITVLKF